jgi:AraC family transcriptional regulator of adaptative response/methylated-DNA-[protein]-cysteine methyltransferase
MAFADELGSEEVLKDMTQRWPKAKFIHDEERLLDFSDQIVGLSGRIRLHIIGSSFQIKVWKALFEIPDGQVSTYSNIAVAIDQPSAARAVGTAIGRNPISFLIPCHRVIQKSGGLGGYHWGLKIKKSLLAFETARVKSN